MNTPEHQRSDMELVQESLTHPHTFAILMERYETKLLRYISRLSRVTSQEAEDILQETYIKAYYNLREVDESLSFSSWIYRIAHNETINAYRKNKARPQGNAFDVDASVINNIVADFNIEGEIDRQYLRKNLLDLLDHIDIKYREVLLLRFFEEKSYDEISDILKKPKGTIATLLNRAKKECYKVIQQQKHQPII